MPTYDFTCEVCGTPGRCWRPAEHPPRFCSRECRTIGMADISLRKPKWPVSPELHEQIKDLYQKRAGMTNAPVVRKFAERIGYPDWKIKRYAQRQGWVIRRKKEPDWSAAELEILTDNAHRGLSGIQAKLKAAGFARTLSGIVQKRKRLRLPANLSGHSARGVAACFGVDVKTVIRWIGHGYLRAIKRGTERTANQGGDYWFIKDKWVRDFIVEHLAEVDLRKVDKYWFVDLLAGDKLGLGPLGASGAQGEARETERLVSAEIRRAVGF